MLQIISGKFFTGSDRHIHDGKGILFSNSSWVDPIETCIGTLEPVDRSGDISGYVFSYKNQIEKDDILVRVGDGEILEQFKLICSFGLGSYFSEYREQVLRVCSPIKSNSSNGFPPSQFLKEKVKLNRRLTVGIVGEFVSLTEKIISLERKSYNRVLSSLRNLSNSLETVEYNIDLSYSMLVYCLESLSQGHGNYSASWDDWDKETKTELEELLLGVPDDVASNIKEVLLKDKHFKLQRRFIDFVVLNTKDSYFINESAGVEHPIKPSQLDKAVGNAYQMRSRYVHALKSIQDQIRSPSVGKQDVYSFNDIPYLTYSGLFRLATHVIKNYIYSLPSVETESFNYRRELPGIVTMEMVSQYWIWRPETFTPKKTNQRLGALLGQLENDKPITDLTKLMEKIKSIFLQTSPAQRAPMIYLFWLYNTVLNEDLRITGWKDFILKNEVYFNELRIENIAVRVAAGFEVPWELHDCIKAYKNYSKSKFSSTSIFIPSLTESAILCCIANKAWRKGNGNEYYWLLNTAIKELSGSKDVQSYIYNSMLSFQELDINKLLLWRKKDAKEE